TGAASGIGRQLARTLAAEGARIAAVDLKPEPLAQLSSELPDQGSAWMVADVTDRSALKLAVADLHRRLGPTDLLIGSAGVGCETSAMAYCGGDIETLIRVNLIGVSNSIDAVLPSMLSAGAGMWWACPAWRHFEVFPAWPDIVPAKQ